MANPSEVIEKFQFARQVTSSGLVYLDGKTMPETRQEQIRAEIEDMDALELGNFIIEEAAGYSSREAGQRLAVMTSHFIFLQDRDVDKILGEQGLVIAARLDDSDRFAISDPSGDEPEMIEGPVAGMLEDVHTDLGWFSLITSINQDSTDLVRVRPLHTAGGGPQIKVTSSRGG